jgi:hypothetical protein
MKNVRWIAVLGIMAFCSTFSLADGIPPDGAVGTARGGKSTLITSLNSTQTFSPCAGATGDVLFDCNLFSGGAQEVFAGINGTGFAINALSVGLSGFNGETDTLGCETSVVFESCSVSVSGSSVEIQFLQGPGGTGVGCFGSNLTTAENLACLANSAANAFSNTHHGTDLPYYNPPGPPTFGCTPPTFFPPGAVCGTDEFVIGVGVDGKPFNTPLSNMGTLNANTPEPQTILLVGGAMISMLMLAIKKARLV